MFATVEAVEFACAKEADMGVTLSVEFANWAANESTGRTDDGDFFHNVIKGVEKFGICPESAMPYETEFSGDTKPTGAATLQETEINYDAAKERFCDLFWVNIKAADKDHVHSSNE